MARQQILWTALPNGYTADGQSLRLSVLASPRLDPQGSPKRVSTFPSFVDWPATVADARFTIDLGGSAVTIAGNELAAANRVDDSIGTGDSARWKALIPGATPINPFEFSDQSTNHVVSYDTGEIETLVRSLYTDLARNAGDGLPQVSDFLDDPAWKQLVDLVRRNDTRLIDRHTGLPDPRRELNRVVRDAPRGPVGLDVHLARFNLFHTPPARRKVLQHTRTDDPRIKTAWVGYEQGKLPAPADFAKENDFHRIVAAMNQYRTLLRRLALVVDFLIDPAVLPQSAGALLTVAVDLPESQPPVTVVPAASPRTRARLTADHFEPLPRPVPQPDAPRAGCSSSTRAGSGSSRRTWTGRGSSC